VENGGRRLSQRKLSVRFNQLKRINTDMGQVQFDMLCDMDFDDEMREALNEFIDNTIKGRDMIDEALS
jgi:hypothetical protein